MSGPNGAGKTTLLRTALALLAPETGTIGLFDRAACPIGRTRRARAPSLICRRPPKRIGRLMARRVVALGRMPHRSAFARLSRADEAAIDDALARCDARDLADRRMDEISAGERARVLLARALATAAPVLLVDEPAAHLDPAHQLQLMELLREEARRGTAVVGDACTIWRSPRAIATSSCF